VLRAVFVLFTFFFVPLPEFVILSSLSLSDLQEGEADKEEREVADGPKQA
jgi:hypothetical protein